MKPNQRDGLSRAADIKVFIVEDSPAVLDRLQEMVGGITGVDLVGDAADYHAAVAGIVATRPDVSILDIKLADERGSGIDVLSRVRAELPGMKAIMLTNHVTPQHLRASENAGADCFLDKSTDSERIPAILEQFRTELERA